MSNIQSNNNETKNKIREFFGLNNLGSLAITLILVFAFRSSLAAMYVVPTCSMEPTMKVGDRVLGFNFWYNIRIPFTEIVLFKIHDVKRGDIAIFLPPHAPEGDFYVKRVIGVAGDKIALRDDVLYVNDQAQYRIERNDQKKILEDMIDEHPKKVYVEELNHVRHWTVVNLEHHRYEFQRQWPNKHQNGSEENIFPDSEYVVPAEAVFCMGDNRDNSLDSRSWGPVPLRYIRGAASRIIWSVYFKDENFFNVLGMNIYWPTIRWARFGQALDSDVIEKA